MIFMGQWYHDDGTKPTDNAKAVAFYSPGGCASGNRHAHLPDPSQRRFIATARHLAVLWHWHLTQGERNAWTALDRGPRDREDEQWDPQHNGYLSFNARNFAGVYHLSSLDANPPSHVPDSGIAEFLITAHIASQIIDYQYSYNALFAEQTQAAVYVYQVNPKNCAGKVHLRQTRLIAKDSEWDEGGGIMYGEAPAEFDFTDYPQVFCLLRVADGGIYHINQCLPSWPS